MGGLWGEGAFFSFLVRRGPSSTIIHFVAYVCSSDLCWGLCAGDGLVVRVMRGVGVGWWSAGDGLWQTASVAVRELVATLSLRRVLTR